MSGRIRTVKPEILEDAVTAGLSDMAFRVFIATIVLADDYGRLRAEPGWLMGQVYWLRTVSVEAFLAAWAELSPLVLSYTVNGQRYAEIRTWSKHQKVSHPGKPRIPPPGEVLRDPPESLARSSGESRETLVPDLRSPTTTTDHIPAPSVVAGDTPAPGVSSPRVGGKRGTRLPDGWTPGPGVIAWAKAQGIADPLGPLDAFRDHWRGVPGAKGTKLDWDATYRNRLRDLIDQGRLLLVEPPPERPRNAPDEGEVVPMPAKVANALSSILERMAGGST